MNIDSIKEIMDGFDPGVLLPDLSTLFGRIEGLCRIAVLAGPVALLLVGLAYLFLSPREANHYFGYRCYYGMDSVQAWRFTQRLAGLVMGILGLILTAAMFFLGTGFHGMEVMDMVWRSVTYLLVEAGLAILAVVSINLTAMHLFDRRGNVRRQKKTLRDETAEPAEHPQEPEKTE